MTGHGPASITVTGVTCPLSGSKTCVMPSLRPKMPFMSELDLDVDACREVEAHQRVYRLRRRAVDVDQPLVRAHLEVLARVLVLERAPDHAVDVLLGGQRHGAGDRRTGALGGLHDLRGGAVQLLVVIALEPDTDLLLRHDLPWSFRYFVIFVTTPAPTVRPPSRTAKRRPSSIAIGWISFTVIWVLSPGMTISWPSGNVISPVTSVVRK